MHSAPSLDGAGTLPTGYAVIEGHTDLKYCSLALFLFSLKLKSCGVLMGVIFLQVGVHDSGAW